VATTHGSVAVPALGPLTTIGWPNGSNSCITRRTRPTAPSAYGTPCGRKANHAAAIVCVGCAEHVILSRRRRRYVRTRGTYQRVPVAPNRLTRPLTSPEPDRVWVADITYVPTQQGWLYLAAVVDMYSRRVVGWAMSERADQALACDALAMALGRRRPPEGAVHHSDQGSQYTSKSYQQQLQKAGLIASMSRKGMPYDNAVMESFFASLKHELTHHERFASRDTARTQLFHYIEGFYNRKRLHSSLGYRSPEAFERMALVPN